MGTVPTSSGMNEQTRKYRIRDWRAHNAALVERGSLTVWFDENAVARWDETKRTGRRGAPRRYSDIAVQCGLVIQEVFHPPLHATEELIRSVLDLLGVALATPDYSTFSRWPAKLTVLIGRGASARPRHVVIDFTCLKVYGEREWHARQRSARWRRTWRKPHLAVDAGNHEMISAELTATFVGDAEVPPTLLEQLPADESVASVAADGAWDTQTRHETLPNRPCGGLDCAPRQRGGLAGAPRWAHSSAQGHCGACSATRFQSAENRERLPSPPQLGRNRHVSLQNPLWRSPEQPSLRQPDHPSLCPSRHHESHDSARHTQNGRGLLNPSSISRSRAPLIRYYATNPHICIKFQEH